MSLQGTSLLHRVRATKAASMQLGEPSKLKRSDGVSLTSPRSCREGSLRDGEKITKTITGVLLGKGILTIHSMLNSDIPIVRYGRLTLKT